MEITEQKLLEQGWTKHNDRHRFPWENFQLKTGRVSLEVALEIQKDESLVDELTSEYKGLTLEEAKLKASTEGLLVRVKVEDGKSLIVTMDLRPNRINVATIEGKITVVLGLG